MSSLYLNAEAQIKNKIKHKEVVAMTVFGGGYSSGAMLIEK
jgi:3-oxoacyl-[acyl-carrier-protein] synthase III